MQRTIIGNLAFEPELDTVGEQQIPRAKLVILENTGVQTKDGWRQDEDPTRHTVFAWRELAQRAAELPKGTPVIVIGREYTRGWDDEASGERRRMRLVDAEHLGVNLRWARD